MGRNSHDKACAETRRTFEKNEVCLANNITYKNPFQAICEVPRLRERAGGRCFCPFQRSCNAAKQIMQHLRRLPEEEKSKYIVCGNDYKSYRSRHHLECARRHNTCMLMEYIWILIIHYIFFLNLDLITKSYGACGPITDPCPASLYNVVNPTPVCGSDKKSYINFEALVCARLRINPSKSKYIPN